MPTDRSYTGAIHSDGYKRHLGDVLRPDNTPHAPLGNEQLGGGRCRIADHSPEAREGYFKRCTTVVSVSAASGVGSP